MAAVSDVPEKEKLDKLLNDLTDATKNAQDLAVEVKESLRKIRRTGAQPKDPKKP
jgi:hypothetical protein